MRRHICGKSKFCNLCFEKYLAKSNDSHYAEHYCPVKQHMPQKEYSNLGFITFQYEKIVSAEKTELRAMLCNIIYEATQRGHFECQFVAETSLLWENVKRFSFNFSYWPSYIESTEQSLSRNFYRSNGKNKLPLYSRQKLLEKMRKIPRLSFVQKLMKTLIHEQFQSYAFIAESSNDLVRTKNVHGLTVKRGGIGGGK